MRARVMLIVDGAFQNEAAYANAPTAQNLESLTNLESSRK